MTIFKNPHMFIINLKTNCYKECCKQSVEPSDANCSICFDSYRKIFNLYNKSDNIIYIKDIKNRKNRIILKRNYTLRNFLRHYINNNPKTQLECNHKFHLECIAKWYARNDSCPLCRCDILLSKKLDIMANKLRYKDQFIYDEYVFVTEFDEEFVTEFDEEYDEEYDEE